MGVLKARVSGAWVDVGLGGGPLNAGGVLGDILVKQSATNSDAVWTTSLPKIDLTSATILDLASTAHPITIGPSSSYNIAISSDRIQGRNNGVASLLRLNQLGGQVIIGAADSSQFPPGLMIADSVHATSRRAKIVLGSGWEFNSDTGGTGTKDFGLLNLGLARYPFSIAANMASMYLDADSHYFRNAAQNFTKVTILGSPNARLLVGDDAELRDVNVLHGFALVSQTDAAKGMLYFGNVGSTGPFIGTANNAYLHCKAASDIYLDGTNHYFRNAAGGDKANFNSAGHLTLPSLTASGDIRGNRVYTNDWFRTYGNGGMYSESYVCGIQFPATGWLSLYAATGFALENGIIRLRAVGDGNHVLQYYNGTPPGSGEANNGALLTGYSSVWIHQNYANKPLYLSSSGNVFIASGQSYSTMSSIEFKDNVQTLDPKECLDHVRHWRPVEFDQKEWPFWHREGFIAEEHVRITPAMVNVVGDVPDHPEHGKLEYERAGWANGIDYGVATVRLTGAVQALLERIETLERLL